METKYRKVSVKEFPKYSVDTEGNVYGVKDKRMSPRRHYRGYDKVAFWDGVKYHERYIHRVVVEAFIEKIPKGLVVNHINGIKYDNRLLNLELVTNEENRQHAKKIGLMKYGDQLPYTKFSNELVADIRRLYSQGLTGCKIAKIYNIGQSYVYGVINYKTRKNG